MIKDIKPKESCEISLSFGIASLQSIVTLPFVIISFICTLFILNLMVIHLLTKHGLCFSKCVSLTISFVPPFIAIKCPLVKIESSFCCMHHQYKYMTFTKCTPFISVLSHTLCLYLVSCRSPSPYVTPNEIQPLHLIIQVISQPKP